MYFEVLTRIRFRYLNPKQQVRKCMHSATILVRSLKLPLDRCKWRQWQSCLWIPRETRVTIVTKNKVTKIEWSRGMEGGGVSVPRSHWLRNWVSPGYVTEKNPVFHLAVYLIDVCQLSLFTCTLRLWTTHEVTTQDCDFLKRARKTFITFLWHVRSVALNRPCVTV
jgi:hypothetical protein